METWRVYVDTGSSRRCYFTWAVSAINAELDIIDFCGDNWKRWGYQTSHVVEAN